MRAVANHRGTSFWSWLPEDRFGSLQEARFSGRDPVRLYGELNVYTPIWCLAVKRLQKGCTMTRMTMAIMSNVGTSLRMR